MQQTDFKFGKPRVVLASFLPLSMLPPTLVPRETFIILDSRTHQVERREMPSDEVVQSLLVVNTELRRKRIVESVEMLMPAEAHELVHFKLQPSHHHHGGGGSRQVPGGRAGGLTSATDPCFIARAPYFKASRKAFGVKHRIPKPGAVPVKNSSLVATALVTVEKRK